MANISLRYDDQFPAHNWKKLLHPGDLQLYALIEVKQSEKKKNVKILLKIQSPAPDLYLSKFLTLSYSTTILEQKVNEGFDIGW